jgi:hypothetical protein
MTSNATLPAAARLSNRAVITQLNLTAWRTVKQNADETAAVNAKHGTRDVATVHQRICAHPALLEIYRLQAALRVEHYRLTLPIADRGMRLLPVNRQVEHADVLRGYRDQIEALLAQFLADYDRERADAPARLGGLYVPGQWPDRATVAAKFGFSVRYLPVPETGQWSEWMAEAAAAAHADLRERLSSAIIKVAQRLSDPDARTYASLTSNLAELLALTPDLNLGSDPVIAEIAQRATALLEHDTDTLRDDPIARADIAGKANEIVSLFNLS